MGKPDLFDNPLCPEKSGLHRFMPGSHNSRDWGLETIPCRAIECVVNIGEKCFAPACCKIGPDGRCMGFKAREKKKEREGD